MEDTAPVGTALAGHQHGIRLDIGDHSSCCIVSFSALATSAARWPELAVLRACTSAAVISKPVRGGPANN